MDFFNFVSKHLSVGNSFSQLWDSASELACTPRQQTFQRLEFFLELWKVRKQYEVTPSSLSVAEVYLTGIWVWEELAGSPGFSYALCLIVDSAATNTVIIL